MTAAADEYCMYCGFGPQWIEREGSPLRPRVFRHHVCAMKPPLTAAEGVAAVCGVMQMAGAIAANLNVQACPGCLRWRSAYVIGNGIGKNDWLERGRRLCFDCFEVEKARRAHSHPYR